MTQFMEPNWRMISHSCLVEEAYFYIYNKFRGELLNFTELPAALCTCCSSRKEIELKLIENFMEKLGPEKRMYGSAQEFLENLKVYKSFPGNRELFNRGAETYQIPSKLYMSLKFEPYIYKPDLYALLQNMTFFIAPPEKGREVEMMIVYYLKAQEEEINKFPEFVKFDQRMFDEMVVELQQRFYEDAYTPQQLAEWEAKYSKLDMNGIIEDFKALIPYSWEDPDRLEVFHKTFEHIWSASTNTPLRATVLSRRYSLANLLIYSLSTIINQRPAMFFPNYATDHSGRTMRTCRVFEDGNQKFLMKWELAEALGEEEKARGWWEADDGNGVVRTIGLNDARRKYETRHIEFIRYPICRAKHRTVPIKSHGANFCLLAVDALFDVLRELIHGVKIFQKCPKAESQKLMEIFKRHEQFHFQPDMIDPYFVPLDMDQCVMRTAREFLGEILDAPAAIVRDSECFTVQNLKEELQHLGLDTNFPEILEHADIVYAEVVAAKKELKLRTCDMYDAVEQCQMICVLERLPNYKKFVHNQQACHRVVGLHCDDCDPEKENPKKTSHGIQKALKDFKF